VLERLVADSEAAGIHSIWPMDQLAQIEAFGPDEEPILEAYTTLAWIAGRSERLELGVLVTGGPWRYPPLLVKTVTTLDVLSGGRAWLGLGASWDGEVADALGLPEPSLDERYERLEEVLVLAKQMFEGDASAFEGRHYRWELPLNQPPPVRRPPILIGGSGRRTLRLVAAHADACNLLERLGTEQLRAKLGLLREECDAAGRPYDEVIKTTFGRLGPLDLSRAVERFEELAEMGIDLALVNVPDRGSVDFLASVISESAVLQGGPSSLRPAPSSLRAPPSSLRPAPLRQSG
jgi:alkanesulfonate monooxygenase SsuD/methylene tetrahydromethanopterin reductase-like flavin-dependent oxidoreductase (luciferase family)